jgi:hypothetical protein
MLGVLVSKHQQDRCVFCGKVIKPGEVTGKSYVEVYADVEIVYKWHISCGKNA